MSALSRSPLLCLEARLRKTEGVETLVLSEHRDWITVDKLRILEDYRNLGIGSSILRRIQAHAAEYGIPIILLPNAEERKQTALFRFYRRLGFRPNRGRQADHSVGGAFGGEWIWRPEIQR